MSILGDIVSAFSSSLGRPRMGSLEMRLQNFSENNQGFELEGIAVEIRGLIPVIERAKFDFVTSVTDVTDVFEEHIVLSRFELFQAPDSPAYQHIQPGGWIEPNQGFSDWTRVGVVVPDLLYPPYGGQRKIRIDFQVSFPTATRLQLLLQESINPIKRYEIIPYYYSGKGYLEAFEDRNEVRALIVKLAYAVSVSDGILDNTEGMVIKAWMSRQLSVYVGEQRNQLKNQCNDALTSAHQEYLNDSLSWTSIAARINEIADESQKYEAVELCFDVMAADSVADESELKIIQQIADALDLNYEEVQILKDKSLIKLGAELSSQASMESILGIKTSWTNEQINSHIRNEFAKWSNRLNVLPEGDKRDNAQKMLDLLAEARKKYG